MTLFLAYTNIPQVEDLARLSIKNKPVWVGVDDAEQESTVDGLEQVTFTFLVRSLVRSFVRSDIFGILLSVPFKDYCVGETCQALYSNTI